MSGDVPKDKTDPPVDGPETIDLRGLFGEAVDLFDQRHLWSGIIPMSVLAVRLWTAFMVALLTLVGYMTVIRENISDDVDAVSRRLRKLLDDQDSNAPDTDLIEFFDEVDISGDGLR